MVWLALWCFDLHFDNLAHACAWMFRLAHRQFGSCLDILTCALMLWPVLGRFSICLDVLVYAWTFCLALWHFGLRLDFLARTLTFWLVLWHFGSHLDVLAHPWMFRLALGCWALGCWARAEKKSNFSIIQTFYDFSRATVPSLVIDWRSLRQRITKPVPVVANWRTDDTVRDNTKQYYQLTVDFNR